MYVCVHMHIRLSSDLALFFAPLNFAAQCLLFGRWFCVHRLVCMLSERQASNWENIGSLSVCLKYIIFIKEVWTKNRVRELADTG